MNVVLLEDVAAMTGVGIALLCVSLSSYLQSPIPDAVGSILIGGLLGCVAVFIIRSNTTHLVGQYVSLCSVTSYHTDHYYSIIVSDLYPGQLSRISLRNSSTIR